MLTQYGDEMAAETAGDAIFKCLETRLKEFHQRWTVVSVLPERRAISSSFSETMKHAAVTRTTESVFSCNSWVKNKNVQRCIDLSRC